MKSKFNLFLVALLIFICCIGAASAADDINDDSLTIDDDAVVVEQVDDVAMDEVVSEVDSDDESISVQENEEIESSDDVDNESLEVSDVEEVDDVDDSSSVLSAEENDNEVSGQTPVNSKNDVLGASFEEIIGESEVIYISQEDFDKSKSVLNNAINNANGNTTIIIRSGTKITRASASNAHANITIIGENRETVLVTSHTIRSGVAVNYNNTLTWVNVTFSCSIELSNTNYKFINCTFLNSPLKFDGARSSLSDPDVYNYAFENCEFVNYTQDNVVVANKFANVAILDSAFDNVTADAIVSTNANRTDDSGRQAGVTIKDSTFKDVTVKGIVKAQNYSVEAVTTDNKYDFATQKTLASDDVVYVDVPVNETTLTVKVADIKEGENFTIDVTLSNNLTTNVSVVINQKEYNVSVINGTGSLKVADKLAANTYNVEASYAGEYPYAASTNTTTFKVEKIIINTALTAPKVSATYNVAKNLVITLKDANGNVLVGKYINVKVGTISKNIQTDKKGQVSVNVATLVPKSYTASISFAGDDDYNKASTTAKVVVSKATPKLTTKKLKTKVKVKTKKVTATLKDNKGKVLKNTKVTLKVKGKTYTAKTNKKGKATFKVTKLNKKGTFKGTVKFAGNKYFKAVSKTVKIVVKK